MRIMSDLFVLNPSAAARGLALCLALNMTLGASIAHAQAQAQTRSNEADATSSVANSTPNDAPPPRSDSRASVVTQGKGRVQLHFANADIEAVVRTLAGLARPQQVLVVDPKVKGQINLQTDRAVSHEEAWQLLLSALRLRGYAVLNSGQSIQLVPEIDAKLHGSAATVFNGTGAPRDGQVGTRIFHLSHESASNLVPVLRPLIGANNTINLNPGTNTLVITDYSNNLDRLARIIESLDVPRTVEPAVIALKHAVAADVVSLITRLWSESGNRAAAPAQGQTDTSVRTSLMADPRSNAVVVRAPNSAQLEQAKALINQLDQPSGLVGSGNWHVVYLKNANAVQLANTLRATMSASPNSPLGQVATNTANAPASSNASSASVASNASSTGGQIQADAATNSLIITAPEPVFRDLNLIIQKLDQRRAQVLVESIIAEVDASKAAQFGIQWQGVNGQNGSNVGILGTNFGTGGNNILNLSTQGASGAALPGQGLNIAAARPVNGVYVLGTLANFLQTQGGANILSTPSLLTLDNEEAKIVVGQNVPFVTGQYTANNSNAGAVNPFQTIERKDVGLTLKVKPQISESGSVKMTIYQEVSSVDSTTSNAGLITNKRSIESNVMVQDGSVIVLGGLLSDTYEGNNSQVPGLGDIPLLGALFKSEARNRKKTNLMVFLRPVVLRDENSTSTLSQQRYREMFEAQQGSHKPGSAVAPVANDAQLPALPGLPSQAAQPSKKP
ncbi:MAG: type secretion system protein [Pseudomonadota bacterium]